MKFLYPIEQKKADNTFQEFPSAKVLEKQLAKEKRGQFGFSSQNGTWHGGLHITENNAPWCKDERPVRAIADGQIVACHISDQYETIKVGEHTLQYSKDFCLIRHQIPNPEASSEPFTFYSLYMHLAPQCAPHPVASENPQKRLRRNLDARLNINDMENSFLLPQGSIVEVIPAKKDGVVKNEDIYQYRNEFLYQKFKLIRKVEAHDKGTELWLEVKKKSEEVTYNQWYSEVSRQKENGSQVETITYKTTNAEHGRYKNKFMRGGRTRVATNTELTITNKVTDTYYRGQNIVYNIQQYTIAGQTCWIATQEIHLKSTDSLEAYAPPAWTTDQITCTTTVDNLPVYSDPQSNPYGEGLVPGSEIATLARAGSTFSYKYTSERKLVCDQDQTRLMARATFSPAAETADRQKITQGWIFLDDSQDQQRTFIAPNQTVNFTRSSQHHVKAGEAIGYLGRHDYQQPEGAPITEYQVHFELFSAEKPPAFFLKAFYGKQSRAFDWQQDIQITTEADAPKPEVFLYLEDQEDCDGYLDFAQDPSTFYRNVYAARNQVEEFKSLIEQNENAQAYELAAFAETAAKLTTADIAKSVNSWDDCKHFITLRSSEWASKAADKPFIQNLQARYADTPYEERITAEISRIDPLAWMTETAVASLKLPKIVWNFWPVGKFKSKWKIIFHEQGTADPAHDVYNQKVEVFDEYGNLIHTCRGSSTPNPRGVRDRAHLTGYDAYPYVSSGSYIVSHGRHRRSYDALWLNHNGDVETDNINPNREPWKSQRIEPAYLANAIHIHKGSSSDWKGSAGCMTIVPSEWDDFINVIPPGEGVVEIPTHQTPD